MSMSDIKANMLQHVETLFAQTSGKASDEDCKEALREFIKATYSSLSSLAWYLGADGKCIQAEAVPASEIADEAYFDIDLEREFELPAYVQPYTTLNHVQQGIAR